MLTCEAKISFKSGEHSFELTFEEAKALLDQLRKILEPTPAVATRRRRSKSAEKPASTEAL